MTPAEGHLSPAYDSVVARPDARPGEIVDLLNLASSEPRRGRRPGWARRRFLAIGDALAIGIAALVGFVLVGQSSAQIWLALATLPVWTLLFKLYGLYDSDAKQIGRSTLDDIPGLVHALMVGELLLWAAYKLFTHSRFHLDEVLTFGLVSLGGVLAARYCVRNLLSHLMRPERLVMVGSGPATRTFVRKLAGHPEYCVAPVGYIGSPRGEDGLPGGLERLGDISDFASVCRVHSADRVVVEMSALSNEEVVNLIRLANELELRITLIPGVSDVLGTAATLEQIEGMAVLGMSPPVLSRSSRMLKRGMDLAVAIPLFLGTLPIVLVSALLVKLTSPGPALFVQQRLGRFGRPFKILKLRTMVADADDRAAELMSVSRHPAWLLLDSDPRVTTVGRFLRMTSIDELPQLWNVIRGDMSLVGPRPMPADIYAHIPEWGRRRLDLTPGITGLWQALGRTSIPFEEMVKLDYLYVTNWSLWEDVQLLLRTLPTVVGRRGAN